MMKFKILFRAMKNTVLLAFLSVSACVAVDPGYEVVEDVAPEAVVTPAAVEVAQAETVANTAPVEAPVKPPVPPTLQAQELIDSGIYAADNESITILQSPSEALAGFPTNRRKEIDWVKAMDNGLIEPRANLDGSEEILPMDMDILMEQTATMPHVKFPHLAHSQWLSCENCHNAIFEPVKDGNPITMGKILKGEYCGRCHDRVAFSLFVCEKCHNTAQ